MDDAVEILTRLYERFNARDIEGVLAALTEDIVWANGMEGGHVHGRAAVGDYWRRQWALVSPRVEPLGFRRTADGAVLAEVRQTLHDLDGAAREGPMLGLADKMVGHVFRFRAGKVARFDIQDID